MELLSIKGFPRILAKTEELKSIGRRDNKLLLLDKCNWFITQIAKKSYAIDKEFNEYVNINSNTFKEVLGRDYKSIQELMFKLGLVEENPKYSKGKFSKSYRLTKKAVKKGITYVPIHSKRFETNYNRYLDKKFDKVYADPLFRKLLDNTAQIKLLNEADNFALPLIPEPEYKVLNDGTETDISELNLYQMDRYDAYFKAYSALMKLLTLETFTSQLSHSSLRLDVQIGCIIYQHQFHD
jgi:hypothetical protein